MTARNKIIYNGPRKRRLEVKIYVTKRYRVRLWLGIALLKAGAWLVGANARLEM